MWHLDEPMTDLSSIPFCVLSRRAREHVTVCLSGEGGDEVFVGYDRFIASKLQRPALFTHSRSRPARLIEAVVRRLPDQEQKKGAVNLLQAVRRGRVAA